MIAHKRGRFLGKKIRLDILRHPVMGPVTTVRSLDYVVIGQLKDEKSD